MEKRDVIKYLVIGVICIVLISLLLILRGGPTGYAVFEYEGEISEKGSYWNKIDMGQGTYNLKVYNNLVNYDNGSEYVAIENSIESSSYLDYEYEVIGEYNLYLQDNIQAGKGIRFERDGYYMTYDLSGGKMQWAVEDKGVPDWGKTKSIGSVLSSAMNIVSSNKVVYNDSFLDTDVQYVFSANILKENLILNSFPAGVGDYLYLEYTGKIEYSGNLIIYANGQDYTGKEFNTTGSIEFKDFDNITIFSLPKPFAVDSDGNYSDLLYHVKISGGAIQFGLKIPASFLENANYPVVIDPSIKLSGGGEDVYVDKLTSNRNSGDKDYLKVQRSAWQRAYLKFNISTIPENQIIDNASLCLFLDNDQGSQTISANHVYDDSWCEGDGGTDGSPVCEITWNNQPCGTENEQLNATNCNTTVESNITTDTSLDDTWQCWDIKNIVRQEYISDNESVSIVLWTVDTGSADIFHSKEYSNNNLWPYLNITYSLSDIVVPDLEIIFPEQDGVYGYNENIDLNYTALDENLDSCWYNLDNGENISLTCGQNTSFDTSEGSHTLYLFANDTIGNLNETSVYFTINLGPPVVNLIFPINNFFVNSQSIEFNYTPIDVDLDSCELWGNFTGEWHKNQTNTSVINNQINQFDLTLEDGSYFWAVWCNDTEGNFRFSDNETFNIDTIVPSLTLSEPTGDKSSQTNIPLTFSVADENRDSCWYNLSYDSGGGAWVVYPGRESVIILNCSSTVFSVADDYDYLIYLTVNDSAGNSNSANSSFSVDTSVSPSLPSDGGSIGGGGGGGYFPSNKTGKLQVSKVGDIIAYEGDKKTLSLNVKNIGRIFLNNCRLIVRGEISSWIYSTKVEGIAFGENVDFVFDLNVPEEIQSGNYKGELEIKCDEGSNIQNISISIPGLKIISIKEIVQEKKILKINYDFDNSNVVGESAVVEIWIIDEDGVEITRTYDEFSIKKEGMIERSVEIQLPGGLAGVYYVYFALSSDLSDFIKQSIVLGGSKTIGFVVLDTFRGKMWVYAVFLLIIAVGIFFIWRRHGKTTHPKNKWLLRKERFF